MNDVEAIVQLADDMEKCQTVLSQLKFASDLDSTGTLRSIVERLPDCLQTRMGEALVQDIRSWSGTDIQRSDNVCRGKGK